MTCLFMQQEIDDRLERLKLINLTADQSKKRAINILMASQNGQRFRRKRKRHSHGIFLIGDNYHVVWISFHFVCNGQMAKSKNCNNSSSGMPKNHKPFSEILMTHSTDTCICRHTWQSYKLFTTDVFFLIVGKCKCKLSDRCDSHAY